MKYLTFICSLLISSNVFGVDPQCNQAVTSDEVKNAMADAKKEYIETLASKSADSSPKPMLPKILSDKKAGNAVLKKSATLEELAVQVDALKNRVIVEKSSLLATQAPKNVKVSGGKTTFNYIDGALYEVTASVDHVTDIALKPGETLSTAPTAGDTVRWHLSVMKSGVGPHSQTHLIVKPLDENIETNLIITTDQNVYHLKLKSGDFHTPSVSWNYPAENEYLMKEALKKEESQELTIRPELLRFDYEIDGDNYDWKPVRVFDDGQKTFIQMSKNFRVTEAPVLFLLEESSDPLIVNYRVKGDFYIVDRLFERAELRVGTERSIQITADDGKNFFENLFF